MLQQTFLGKKLWTQRYAVCFEKTLNVCEKGLTQTFHPSLSKRFIRYRLQHPFKIIGRITLEGASSTHIDCMIEYLSMPPFNISSQTVFTSKHSDELIYLTQVMPRYNGVWDSRKPKKRPYSLSTVPAWLTRIMTGSIHTLRLLLQGCLPLRKSRFIGWNGAADGEIALNIQYVRWIVMEERPSSVSFVSVRKLNVSFIYPFLSTLFKILSLSKSTLIRYMHVSTISSSYFYCFIVSTPSADGFDLAYPKKQNSPCLRRSILSTYFSVSINTEYWIWGAMPILPYQNIEVWSGTPDLQWATLTTTKSGCSLSFSWYCAFPAHHRTIRLGTINHGRRSTLRIPICVALRRVYKKDSQNILHGRYCFSNARSSIQYSPPAAVVPASTTPKTHEMNNKHLATNSKTSPTHHKGNRYQSQSPHLHLNQRWELALTHSIEFPDPSLNNKGAKDILSPSERKDKTTRYSHLTPSPPPPTYSGAKNRRCRTSKLPQPRAHQ